MEPILMAFSTVFVAYGLRGSQDHLARPSPGEGGLDLEVRSKV
jgi:hypothetical protein